MYEDVSCRQGNAESKDLDIHDLLLWMHTHHVNKMPESKASFLQWQDKLVQMSHLRNVALYCNRQFFHSNERGCVWFLTLSYTQGKFDLFLLFSLFYNLYHGNSHQITHVSPLCPNINLPSLSFSLSLSHSLSLSSSCKTCLLQDNCICGKFCIATEQNNYIFIYVQWKWMHTSYIFMEQTFRMLTLD